MGSISQFDREKCEYYGEVLPQGGISWPLWARDAYRHS